MCSSDLVMRYSAFNTLEFAAYLKLEFDLAFWLVQQGYEVIYKAHPESDWRYFDTFFPKEVKINWSPFEDVVENFDAVFYHFGASSTLPSALASPVHVFMLKDGWHDKRLWPERIQKFFSEYCNMVPATIDQNDLICLDFDVFADLLAKPKPVSPPERVHDFYHRSSFS